MPLHILYWLVASCASLSGGGRLALRPAASFGDVGCSLEAAPWNLNEFKVTYIYIYVRSIQIYSNLQGSMRSTTSWRRMRRTKALTAPWQRTKEKPRLRCERLRELHLETNHAELPHPILHVSRLATMNLEWLYDFML